MEGTFVIVGGGIAGVSCAETLAFLEPQEPILLLSESSLIKTAINLHAITKTITSFDVEEKDSTCLTEHFHNLKVIHDSLLEIKPQDNQIVTKNGQLIKYKYLCLCMGAEPKLIPQAAQFSSHIIGIRDTDSVERFIEKLKDSKKIIIVGNGGIASELVHKIQNTEVHWVVKDKHITSTFVDPGAAEFFLPSLKDKKSSEEQIIKRMRYGEETKKSGAALGPDWYKLLTIKGGNSNDNEVSIHYQAEIAEVKLATNSEYALEVLLSNRETIFCDLIVSATGVNPRQVSVNTRPGLQLTREGGIKVNEYLQTNLHNVYAAGDICQANWNLAKHWFQMKLWTQARQMGCYAAKSMYGHFKKEEVIQDFCFEMFAHSTKLFGYKVILLGLYNGQKLGNDYEILLRMTKNQEYVKFVMQNHRLQGAVLIGETDLEEMCENLILNQLDLSAYGDDILNPNIDIEDYFD